MMNPYQTPKHDQTIEGIQTVRSGDGILRVWVGVFLLNLLVPVVMAWPFTTRVSWMGLVSVSAIFLLAGTLICYWSGRWGQRLIFGSVVTALSQFVPILHLFAGLVGINCVRAIGLAIDNPSDIDGLVRFQLPGVSGVMIVGLFVGSVLSVVALFFGSMAVMFFPKVVDWVIPLGGLDAVD